MNNKGIFKISRKILLKKRAAVAEIIVNLLMVAITVIGAILIWTLFSSSEITSIGQSVGSSADTAFSGVKLLGYDTRDGLEISGIVAINNGFDRMLCAHDECVGDTEHIVLKIRNLSSSFAIIENIQINGIAHTWDSSTGGNDIDAEADGPGQGMFSIIPISGDTTQQSSNEITNADVRLVIRLSEEIDSEIELDQVMRVVISVTNGDLATFLIPAGATV